MSKEKTIKCFGIPVYKCREKNGLQKKYVLGIRYHTKKLHEPAIYNLNSKKLNVVFKLSGGLGDMIISLNYILQLQKYLHNSEINFYICGPKHLLLFLCKENNLKELIDDKDLNDNSHAFDVFVKLVRFPQLLYAREEKVAEFSTDFLKLLYQYKMFQAMFPRFFNSGRTCDVQVKMIAKIYNKNRLQTPDIWSNLGIKDINYDIMIPPKNLHKDYGISALQFITVHRGNDLKNKANCVKLWPIGYYGILVKMLKQKYPEYQIVQLGVNKERCPDMENVDINLVGKTSLEDVAFLLKHSALHIDCEGGFVHLRHALHGGKTVVLFGPTDIAYYGYSENINLRTDVCSGCEWVREKWLESCIKEMRNPACMYSLTPEYVFSEIVKSEVLNG